MIAKFASFAVLSMTTVLAQTGAPVGSSMAASNKVAGLPSAPVAQTLVQSAADSLHIPASAQQAGSVPASAPVGAPETPALPAGAPGAEQLSIKDAEQLALKNNPQISVARLTALASQQGVREQRSALWPTAVADLTGVDSEANSRITAGGLNNPLIYERAAVGASVTQLITDFGRTSNLVSSARLAAKAQDQNALATEEQIRLAADQAFYNALQAHSVTQVAQQTLNARQAVADQIQALFSSKLKSQLDLSFANVNLSQAKLLLLDSQNNENASMAALSAVLGFANLKSYQLVEDTTPLVAPTANVDDLISQSFAQRPELLALGFEYQSAKKFQTAERDLLLPAIRAAGAIGDTPVRNPALSNWYGAVGVNIDIPIFNGFLYSARAREASLRSQAANERVRDMRDRISRDVRTSWLNAGTAYSRLAVAQELLNQSNLALDLAQTRYKLGLSSIVELSQAQLQQTQAEIGNTQASYDYRLAVAVLRYETGTR
jgi:outer membrane protein